MFQSSTTEPRGSARGLRPASRYNRSGTAVKYTHEQIAAITGINRVSVSRILNGMAREGIISLGYRKINVLDPEALSRVFNALGLPEG